MKREKERKRDHTHRRTYICFRHCTFNPRMRENSIASSLRASQLQLFITLPIHAEGLSKSFSRQIDINVFPSKLRPCSITFNASMETRFSSNISNYDMYPTQFPKSGVDDQRRGTWTSFFSCLGLARSHWHGRGGGGVPGGGTQAPIIQSVAQIIRGCVKSIGPFSLTNSA